MTRILLVIGCWLVGMAIFGAGAATAADLFDALSADGGKPGEGVVSPAEKADGAKDEHGGRDGATSSRVDMQGAMTYGVMTRFGNKHSPGNYGDAGRDLDLDLDVRLSGQAR